ncbi:MAG: hypothetical protein WCY34_01545 [Candidatus Omnitrophota bacterium]|jgi:hypothetical protein
MGRKEGVKKTFRCLFIFVMLDIMLYLGFFKQVGLAPVFSHSVTGTAGKQKYRQEY